MLATVSSTPAAIEEDLCNKRIYGRSFKGMNLAGKKLTGSAFIHCCFDDADLTRADCSHSDFSSSSFRNTVMYETNFAQSSLSSTVFEPKDAYGITLTLQCKTFSGVQVSPLWSFAWMIFFLLMKHKGTAAHLPDDVIASIGAERYAKIMAMFCQREF